MKALHYHKNRLTKILAMTYLVMTVFPVLQAQYDSAYSLIEETKTTIEEYNYVTKGYKIQLESGLDMKRGYSVKDLSTYRVSPRQVELKVLFKNPEGHDDLQDSVTLLNRRVVAYMLLYKKDGLPDEYICIPHPNSDQSVKKLFWNSLYNSSMMSASERLQIISYIMSFSMSWSLAVPLRETAGTSIEEFNYVTKGYKVQQESGLDMKRGYYLFPETEEQTSERKAELLQLARVPEGYTGGIDSITFSVMQIAAYMLKYERVGSPDEYICIPNPNSSREVFGLFWNQLYNSSMWASSDRLQLITYTIAKQLDWYNP
jgi:hypothetical protein